MVLCQMTRDLRPFKLLRAACAFCAVRVSIRRVVLGLSTSAALASSASMISCSGEAPRESDEEATGPRPDIVFIVLDTVRKDRLSTYGYARDTSPNLSRISKRGRRFTNAYATSSWTTPSHASLFTGLYPVHHGATQENWVLSSDVNSIAEILGEEGYQTVGVAGNVMITKERGFAQGFEIYHESWRGAKRHLRDALTVDWLADFFAKRDDPRPLFLFINLIGAHAPYDSCGDNCGAFGEALDGRIANSFWKDFYLGSRRFTDDQFDRLNRLYDAELREVDANVGRIVRNYDKWRDGNTSFIAITSDHGENIGEHDHVNHVFSLYETTVQIPLVVRYPPAFEAGTVDANPTQLVDLFSTALVVARAPDAARSTHGQNLLDEAREPRAVLTEYYLPEQAMLRIFPDGTDAVAEHPRLQRYHRQLRSLTRDGWKLIWGSDGKHELYNLNGDPKELRNLIAKSGAAKRRDALLKELEQLVGRYGEGAIAPAGAQQPLDSETQAELRALGYLE